MPKFIRSPQDKFISFKGFQENKPVLERNPVAIGGDNQWKEKTFLRIPKIFGISSIAYDLSLPTLALVEQINVLILTYTGKNDFNHLMVGTTTAFVGSNIIAPLRNLPITAIGTFGKTFLDNLQGFDCMIYNVFPLNSHFSLNSIGSQEIANADEVVNQYKIDFPKFYRIRHKFLTGDSYLTSYNAVTSSTVASTALLAGADTVSRCASLVDYGVEFLGDFNSILGTNIIHPAGQSNPAILAALTTYFTPKIKDFFEEEQP